MIRRMISLFLTGLMLVGLPGGANAQGTVWQLGDKGEEVTQIQRRLSELGYLEEQDVSGTFDEKTKQAVETFQRRNDLLETGMVEQKTWDVLFSDKALELRYASPDEADVLYEDADGGMMNSYMPYASYAMPAPDPYGSAGRSVMATGAPVMMTGITPKQAGFREYNTSEYSLIREQGFVSAASNPLSTFQADVDTSSYTQLRANILAGREVNPDSVRIEEMLNYFRYDYPEPREGEPFGVKMEIAPCPWNEDTALLQIGLRASSVKKENRPRHSLVFLIDTSGSMSGENRLDLVKRAFLLMLEALDPEDTVSIVTYASMDTVVLEGVPARERGKIMEAIEALEPYGSTNGTAGLLRAYEVAQRHFVQGGVNRILMATDGDLNTGAATSEGDLARLVMEKKQSGVQLTMLGFGYGNYKDNKMEALAAYGDGQCWYIDNVFEARRALVTEADGTFITVAGDVKLQLDFNPSWVGAYRLIGYEHKLLAAEEFADDTVDGGDIGSGHMVTALYEIIPAGSPLAEDLPSSKYAAQAPSNSAEWLTLSIRCKAPGSDESSLYTYPLTVEDLSAQELSDNLRFAAAVAETGMLLRDSEWKGSASYESAAQLLRDAGTFVLGDPLKEEFLYLVNVLARGK